VVEVAEAMATLLITEMVVVVAEVLCGKPLILFQQAVTILLQWAPAERLALLELQEAATAVIVCLEH
jgi:hypothetical protein